MEIVSVKNWSQDSNGKWWFHSSGMKDGHRIGGILMQCDNCKKYMPKIPSITKRTRTGLFFCSHLCSGQRVGGHKNKIGEKSHCWKGGKMINGKGYVDIYSRGHPNARGGKYVLEHRLVMEKKIGRYLLPSEHVHHKNGIKTDNRVENLELWSCVHPTGIRNKFITCPHCNKKFISKNHE